MARTNQIGRHRTTVHTQDGVTTVTYHSTPVVTFTDAQIILDTGGWFSNTTKLRMNQAARQFKLPYSVYQKDNIWYVAQDGQPDQVFFDGYTVLR